MGAAAGMAAAQILNLIEQSGGVLGAAETVIERFNKLFGGVQNVQEKTRWLEVTLVNLSTDYTLTVEDQWFDSGRFWTQPFGSIGPARAITYYVCDRDGSIMTGVSGGVGLQARNNSDNGVFTDGNGNSWWICVYSNPFMGSQKCLTRWKSFGIKPLFDEMHDTTMVRDSRCGCYMKEDKKLVFIWKNRDSPW